MTTFRVILLSRESYLYTVQFLDHATKYAWVYPLKTRDKFIETLRDLIDVKLKLHGVQIKHYHMAGASVAEARRSSLHVESCGDAGT